MNKSKIRKKLLSIILTILLVFGMLPTAAFAIVPNTVTVQVIGENGILVNETLSISSIVDYTTDSSDTNSGLNALDAVITATQPSSSDEYSIPYNTSYSTYYISKLDGILPSGYDYWGTLAVSTSGVYDGNALSTHAVESGDTYTVYYDKSTGCSANYGYQSYAWFTSDNASGTTGSPIEIEAKTTAYDDNWNTVAAPLTGATVYASGGSYSTPTPIAVTDSYGKAYIYLPDAEIYSLTLSSDDYTYAQSNVTATGDSVVLFDVNIPVTDGTNPISNASLTLTTGSKYCSAYSTTSSSYSFRLLDGTYNYSASANGYSSKTGTITVSGSTYQPVILTANTMSGYAVTITPGDTENESVKVKDSSGAVQTAESTASGIYTYDLVDGSYTYTISRSGYHSLFSSFSVNGKSENITTAALTDMAADSAIWSAFRKESNNMAAVSDSTAKGSWQAEEAWTTSLGELGTWGTLSTSNVVIYDGYLYIATEHGLSKVDASTGTLLKTTALSTDTGYVIQIACGAGKIFVTTGSGVDAFDALTMEKVWEAEIYSEEKYMASTPIVYDAANAVIYVGNYGDSKYTIGTYGGYSAINVSDGSVKWTKWGGEADAFYWAGAVIVGNYLVYGSDSGVLTSLDKNSTEITAGSLNSSAVAGEFSATGKIHSSVAYDGTYLYFTTSSGYIYKLAINADTGALSLVSSRQFATGSSSTPVVCNGKIYVGANDGIYVLNSSDLSQVSFCAESGAVQSSALVTTAYSDAIYAYFTINSARGEAVVLKDDGTNISCEMLYTPSHEQYCLGSLISDSNGTIYYSNDSGYLSAIDNTNAANTDKSKVEFVITPSSLFDSTSYTTTYPTVTVKDSGNAEVTTSAGGVYYLCEGNYTYTVNLNGYTTSSGSFSVEASDISSGSKIISVTLSSSSTSHENDEDETITTTVSVLGYQSSTILSSRTITVENEASAWDAIKEALDNAGISYVATDTSMGVYISSVNGLAEFDKGTNSGWLYTVDGTAPSVSASNYTLNGGEKIVLYYTADYITDSSSGSSGGSASLSNKVEADLSSKLNESTGVANATLSGDALIEFKEDLAAQSDTKGTKATINVTLPSGVTAENLTIPQAVMTVLSNKTNTSLYVTTDIGSLTINPIAIDNINNAAAGNDITLSITKLDNSTLSKENRELVGEHPVYGLSIICENVKITDFGTGFIEVSIPYTPSEDEDTSKLTVYYLDSDGNASKMTGAVYNEEAGCIIFTTNHFSTFAVVYTDFSDLKIFSDVSESDWYYQAVQYAKQNNLMNGTSDTTFEPNADMTRAMVVTALYNIEEKPTVTDTAGFTDVQDGKWYTDAINWACENGIVAGYGGGLFGTNDSVTREQLMMILLNFANYKQYDTTKTISLTAYMDASTIDSWAMNAMQWAVAEGLITGTTAETLSPIDTSTRAQVAMILMNFSKNQEN